MIPLFLLMWFGKGLMYILSEFTYLLNAINPFLISRLTYFLNVLHVLMLDLSPLNCKQISHPIYTNIGKMTKWACKTIWGTYLSLIIYWYSFFKDMEMWGMYSCYELCFGYIIGRKIRYFDNKYVISYG
jgi:hypothetical protein